MENQLTRKEKKAIYMESYMVKYREGKKGSDIESEDDLPRENTYMLLRYGGAKKLPNATSTKPEAQTSTGTALKLIIQYGYTLVVIKLTLRK